MPNSARPIPRALHGVRTISAVVALIAVANLTAAPARAQMTLDCNVNPFGNNLVVGEEREVYLGFSKPGTGKMYRGVYDGPENDDRWESVSSGDTPNSYLSAVDFGQASADLVGDDAKDQVLFHRNSSNGNLRVESYSSNSSYPEDTWEANVGAVNNLDAVGGQIISGANDQVILGYLQPTLSLLMLHGGQGSPLMTSGLVRGQWTSSATGFTTLNENKNLRNLSLATGDIDGDGVDEIVFAFRRSSNSSIIRLGIVEFDPANAGSNYELADIGLYDIDVGGPTAHVIVEVGDIDQALVANTLRDEIVLLTDRLGSEGATLPTNQFEMRAFTNATGRTLDPGEVCLANDSTNGSLCMLQSNTWSKVASTHTVDLAIADTDRDATKELIIAYDNNHQTLVETWNAETFFSAGAPIVMHNQYNDEYDLNDEPRRISVDAADIDLSGQATIFAAYSKLSNDSIETIRLLDSTADLPGAGMTYFPIPDDGNGSPQKMIGVTTSPRVLLEMADSSDDSIHAVFEPAATGACAQVVEAQVSELVYAPPHWDNLTNKSLLLATIGEDLGTGTTTSSTVSHFNNHSVSVFAAATVGIGTGLVKASATLTATASKEFERSSGVGPLNEASSTFGVSVHSDDDFLVVEESTYNCYQYQFEQGEVPILAGARMCELQPEPTSSPPLAVGQRPVQLSEWDVDELENATPTVTLRHWIPATRPWASLTLATPDGAPINPGTGNPWPIVATASSSASGQFASRAIDNGYALLDNSTYAVTQAERTPWVQVDLGSVQDISKVRVWNRSGDKAFELDDFHIFVSEIVPQNISNDPAVLATSPLVAYDEHFADGTLDYAAGHPATTARTLLDVSDPGEDSEYVPARGRYVRVQLADDSSNRALGIAEIQVFGPNHVEPSRYPRAIANFNSNSFQVEIHDRSQGAGGAAWKWVQVPGAIEWDGSTPGGTFSMSIERGGTGLDKEWTRTDDITDGSVFVSSSTVSTTVGIGMEAAFEVAGTGVSGGGSTSSTRGLTTEATRTATTSSGLEVAGRISQLDSATNSACEYDVTPYFYTSRSVSDYGFEHEFRVIDYFVPSTGLSRDVDLNDCLNPLRDIQVWDDEVQVRIVNGDSSPDPLDGTDMGSVLYTNPLTQTFEIHNESGTAGLSLDGPSNGVDLIEITGDPAFTITSSLPGTDQVIAAGNSFSFDVTFTPTVVGTKTATISIHNNDADDSPAFGFAIQATGLTDDTDGDGIKDVDEAQYGTNPTRADSDFDGLTDYEEVFIYLTIPWDSDTDDDIMQDGDEIAAGTDPFNPDTDGDNLIDGDENDLYGTSPLEPDSDFDGLPDDVEVAMQLAGRQVDPLVPDSDGDGHLDGDEVAQGALPDDPNSVPYSLTFTVCPSGCSFTTIASAISSGSVTDGDVIDIQADVTEKGILIYKSLTFTSSLSDAPIVQADAARGVATDRVFYIFPGYNVRMENLVIRHGNFSFAGGIYNSANLVLDEVTIIDNVVAGGGAGLFNAAGSTAVIRNSTIAYNDGVTGGGIYNDGTSVLRVYGSTISHNNAPNGGAGIFNSQGDVHLSTSTFSGNSLRAIQSDGGTFEVTHTILANSVDGLGSPDIDCALFNGATITEGYFNVVEDPGPCAFFLSSGFGFLGDPNLGPLQDNGGPTMTHALLAGSIAIDEGAVPYCDIDATYPPDCTRDQRGANRLIGPVPGAAVDIGAYELGDVDADGAPDTTDNCPSISNPAQGDVDGDGAGDACDTDSDADGFSDLFERAGQVFVRSVTTTGNLGGLAGADALCNADAAAAGLNGTFTAWLSTSTVDARDRITDQPYVRPDGQLVAVDLADVTDGSIAVPLNVTADGSVLTAGRAFTGSSGSGTYVGQVCNDWTDGGAVAQAQRGETQGTNSGSWTSGIVGVCAIPAHLYCFGDAPIGFDPLDPDTDGDGICDGGTSVPGQCAAGEDDNFNGFVDAGETNPLDADTDGDGLGDLTELAAVWNPVSPDTDNDGLCDGAISVPPICVAGEDLNANGVENSGETWPTDPDTDDDGLDDGLEVAGLTDPVNADSDGDGLCDGTDVGGACTLGEDLNLNGIVDPGETDPNEADSDGDGIDDDIETFGPTSPIDPDSDDDGLCDGPNTIVGVCVGGEDANANGIVDTGETDPNDADSDDDGASDGYELAEGTDPLDPGDFPIVTVPLLGPLGLGLLALGLGGVGVRSRRRMS